MPDSRSRRKTAKPSRGMKRTSKRAAAAPRTASLTAAKAAMAPAPARHDTFPGSTLADVAHARSLFWHDIIRQMLTGLSMIQETNPELFDGRTAVLTHAGERIPIAEVFPLFACGLPNSEQAKAASIAVECTVFRILTPSGEVFTLPVHEVRALHSLTPELIKELEQSAMSHGSVESSDTPGPFGFAAYTRRPSAPADPVDAAI